MSTPTEAERMEALRHAILKAGWPDLTSITFRHVLKGSSFVLLHKEELEAILTWHLAELDRALGAPTEDPQP